ncbi:MAG: twin-arginine translocase TatA/TatE family subunit [Flavobacteriales bacterium]|nr:twin-arginine translocase TatA/TatE family subunit [Flavobacteriales bacterium]
MENITYAAMPGMGSMVLILVAILLLFGGKKIPELMKGLGKGMKEFKDASASDKKEEEGNSDDK